MVVSNLASTVAQGPLAEKCYQQLKAFKKNVGMCCFFSLFFFLGVCEVEMVSKKFFEKLMFLAHLAPFFFDAYRPIGPIC